MNFSSLQLENESIITLKSLADDSTGDILAYI